ncbi:MAG: stage 0 sporulation family protein [Clostridia bacterium]|nr:stage 0 sporulation family protein [Clostridia bacterium]
MNNNANIDDNENIINDKDSDVINNEQIEVIGVRFKDGGKVYYFDPNNNVAKITDFAVVETSRGLEFGKVACVNKLVDSSEVVPPLRPVVRIANENDIKVNAENKRKEAEALKICQEKISAHGLEMKLIEAEYTFDASKLTFYFTADGRIDFRDLVKDLASTFRTRIELRQIGIRDEAKLMGGLGVCGRAFCCNTFLPDFCQVSIKMAKEQNLSLNSAKISGACGRLMCCLRFEHDTYAMEIRRTPPVDSTVKTADGIGQVTEIAPLSGMIKVKIDESIKSYHRDDVKLLSSPKTKNKNDDADENIED